MSSPQITKKHLNGLTGLRFWAAAVVMLYHFTSYLGPIPGISEITRFGNSGVTFFFVLSGFVLAWTYIDVQVPTRVFYWRRFARIWPLHILTTIFSLAAWRLVDHPIGNTINVETLWPAFFLVHSWFSEPRIIQGGSGASWSLSAEAFFYALFPILLVTMARIQSRRWLISIPVLCTFAALTIWLFVPEDGVGSYSRGIFLAYFPPVRLTQFVAGVALGLAAKRGWLPKVSLSRSLVVIAIFFATMIVWSENVDRTSMWYPQSPAQLLSIMPFGLLIISVANADIAGRQHAFKGRWIELLGHASFALYLIHVPAALIWQYLLGKPTTLGVSIIAWSIVSVVAIAISICLYKYFERPLERKLRGLVTTPAVESSGWRVKEMIATHD